MGAFRGLSRGHLGLRRPLQLSEHSLQPSHRHLELPRRLRHASQGEHDIFIFRGHNQTLFKGLAGLKVSAFLLEQQPSQQDRLHVFRCVAQDPGEVVQGKAVGAQAVLIASQPKAGWLQQGVQGAGLRVGLGGLLVLMVLLVGPRQGQGERRVPGLQGHRLAEGLDGVPQAPQTQAGVPLRRAEGGGAGRHLAEALPEGQRLRVVA